MTDQELIDLLAQKTPEELTPAEVDLLRARLAESPDLRQVLFEQLQMETYLSAALGPVSITPQQIVARAQSQTQPNSGGVLLVLAMLVAVPLLLLVGAVLVRAWQGTGEVVADANPAEDAKKSAEESAKEKNGDNENDGKSQPRANPLADTIRAAQGKPPLVVNPPEEQPKANPAEEVKPATPMPPPGPPPLPWQAVVDATGQAPPLSQVSFQPFDPTKSLPQRDDLRIWFEQVPGHSLRLNKVDTRYGSCGAIEGMARLKSPWPEGAVLRLALENYKRLKLHFFHGEVGATFVYYEDENFRWVAYATTRDAGNYVPKTWAMTGTDDQRAARSEIRQGGPIEFRYHDGEVILSRGDIVLTSAPLPGPPDDVLFDGRAAIEGIALARTKDLPLRMPSPPVVYETDRPADLDWKSNRPEVAQPEKLADGRLKFATEKPKETVACFTQLPYRGLSEVILELTDVQPGSGVFLCNEKGECYIVARFYENRRGGQMYAMLHNADSEWRRDFEPPQEKPASLVASERSWVKLLYGCGLVRCWISADGKHWAEPVMAIDSAPPRLTHLGLHLHRESPSPQVTLRRVTVREFAGLSALADAKLRERAIALPEMPAMGPWLAEVLTKKPAEVATADWLRACAIATLAARAHRDLAYPLLEALFDDMTARNLPLAAQQAALADATVLSWDYRDGGMMRKGIPRRLLELGLAEADASGVPAWSSVRETVHTAPLFSWLLGPLELERSVRTETIQRANGMPPAESLDYTRRLRLFNQERYSPLVGWLESLAARDVPGKPSGEGLAKIRDGWRDPLIEDLSKETYNATTEIQAVLESEAWPDAARLITSVDAESAPGVAPYIRDRALLASLPVAVQLTLADYPQVRDALAEKFGPLARLRVGQAMSAGDAATVEMATVQFAGTDAAGEAHQWLGDRALASGWFERAIAEYRRAIAALPPLRSQVEPRIRLAAAMLGREEGEPIAQAVQFGELSMNPAEFEALVLEMRNRGNAQALSPIPPAATANPLVPAAKRYEAHVRSRLDGPVGDRPQEEVGERRTNQFRVPWADRQIATVVEGDVLYVGNHFQIAAYNLTNGQRMWQSQTPPGQMQRSQDWALIAMQPLVTGNRIYTRLLYSPNPLLACLEKSSGKLLWTAEAPPREFFVSDPVVVQGQLGAVSVSVQLEQQGLLRWNVLDPETGELQSQRDLVRLRNTWGKRACCELVPLADSVVAVLGGITLALDPDGKVRWVRKHVTVPAEEDPRWILQTYQRPLLADGRMFVAQPGVRSIDCLDPATGRLHWSVVMPEALGMIGLSGTSLVVRTERDLRALDRTTGQTLWRLPVEELHSFQLVDDESLIIASRERLASNNDQWLTRLTWIDARTGQPTKTCSLLNLTDNDPRLGPLVPYKDRVFTFFGRGQHDPNRDLVELVPAGEADAAITTEYANDPWRQKIPPTVRNAAFRVLPDWLLTSGFDGDRTGLMPDIHGERDVLGVRSLNVHAPIVLAREISLPAMGRPRLRLRIGTDGGQVWKLEVRHGEQLLKTEEIKDETHPDRWKMIEVDLTPAAGKSGWLSVKLTCANGDHVLWLKSAEIVY